MHKIVNKSAPNYIVEILSNAVNVDKHYKLRNEDDIEQFQFRTEKFRKSLFPDCVRKWNSLEKDLRKDCSFNSFRTKVITNTVANCSKLYYVGQRKFNIILAQLRMNQSGPTHVGNCYRCAAVLQTAHQAADHHTSVPVILQMLDLDLDTHFVVCWRKWGCGGRG